MISLDTTRADALSTYGGLLPFQGEGTAPKSVTPVLDALAGRGVRFDQALAHAPTTLSSHASVFTGFDSHGHGVVRNGFKLGAEESTLAEAFAAGGYETVGVVGASVLSKKYGIARGFSVWNQEFSVSRENRHEALASEVTARALGALQTRNAAKPLFLFVHYFDAHAPYNAPEPYTKRFGRPDSSFDGSQTAMRDAVERSRQGQLSPADVAEVRARYLGEVAYVDEQIGALFDGLAGAISSDIPRITIIFGDHGEGLGEEALNPFGHGGSVDPWSIRVPLIVSGTGVPSGVVVGDQARLMDIGATTLALAGLPARLGNGVDLGSRWRTGTAPIGGELSFAEASQPGQDAAKEGWPNLPFSRAAYRGGWACQRFPLSYPGTLTFAVTGSTQVGSPLPEGDNLCDALAEWDRRVPAATVEETDEETRESLRALGYVDEPNK